MFGTNVFQLSLQFAWGLCMQLVLRDQQDSLQALKQSSKLFLAVSNLMQCFMQQYSLAREEYGVGRVNACC